MKKLMLGFLVLILTFTCSLGALAAKVSIDLGNSTINVKLSDQPNPEPNQPTREDAQYVIHRTATVLSFAIQSLSNQRFRSGMALAIANQQKARELYSVGAYPNAIFHSLRARDLALNLLRQNQLKFQPEFLRDPREDRYAQGAPDQAILDRELDMSKVGNDRDVFRMHFELDTPQDIAQNPAPVAAPRHEDVAPNPPRNQNDFNTPGQPTPEFDRQLREDAQYVIHRTATALSFAMKSLSNKRYRSGMALAIANQQKARELYSIDAYQNAIFHSLRARDLVLNLLRQNRLKFQPEFLRDPREDRYAQGAPNQAILDRELDMSKVGNDRDVFRKHFELDTPQDVAQNPAPVAAPHHEDVAPNPPRNQNDLNAPGRPNPAPNQQLREDAQYVIHRTATVLSFTIQSLGNKRYLSGLALAIANQQKARELFNAGAYQNAIFHSLRARDLALNLLRQNQLKFQPDFLRDPREDRYGQTAPNNAILDRELDMSKVGNDRDIFRMHFELDIN